MMTTVPTAPRRKGYGRGRSGVVRQRRQTGPGWKPLREKNAQMIVLKKQEEQFFALLQLRSDDAERMPGHLTSIGGKREPTDKDSSATAVREAYEEAGLLDLAYLEGTPAWLHTEDGIFYLKRLYVPPPQKLVKFSEGAEVDWWVLLLEGSGVFEIAQDADACADVKPLLPLLPQGAHKAPCFGHLWLPVDGKHPFENTPEVQVMTGLKRKICEAVKLIVDLTSIKNS